MITRKDAIYTIYDIINSGIISEELEGNLQDIANCIEAEDENLFIWGADDDVHDLFVLRRADLIDEEWEQHLDKLYEKYRIKSAD